MAYIVSYYQSTNLARENIKLEKDFLNVKELILESLSYFDEELKRKRVILHLKDMQVFMNRADLEDVLYNLIGNAIGTQKVWYISKYALRLVL